VPLEGPLRAAAAAATSGDVIVGMRPEDVRAASDAPPSYSVRLRGKVEVVEPLGSETYVLLRLGESTLTARFPPRSQLAPGDEAELAVNPAHVHLFDAESERNLLLAGSGAPVATSAEAAPVSR
jgi:multiple sugar transport system ATP-binding protein